MSVSRRMEQAFSLRDEDGVTTVGMVVSLLLALSMIFSSAQVYRIQSVSSRVQSVADAGALAAGNVVAEFMVAVRVCDSVALSLSLTSLTSTGLGIVACCVPGGQGVGAKLLEAGARVADARDSFSKTASEGLTRVQKALPFLAAASAASVAQGNGSNGSDYTALALLVPDSVEDIRVPQEDARAKQAREDALDQAEEVKELAQRAEEAAVRAQDAKQRAFEHDCGARPGWCMAERAETLAHMTGAQNPVYSSVDAWSFSVALRRAQAYYPARLAVERLEDGSVQAQAQSALRKRFYAFAAQEVSRGYVREGDSFEALFPHLPANTAQMRETELFTQAVYPVGVADGSPVLHAWDGCPKAVGSSSRASLRDMEAGAWETCSECGFTAASLGKVAAASTSIGNGFEHHYEQVALAAEEYQKALEEGAPAKQEAKNRVSKLLDQLRDACLSVGSFRIDADPPGGKGVVCLAVNTGPDAPDKGFESAFVQASGQLGCRVAISAATLVADPSGEGRSVIASLTDGFASDSALAGVLGAAAGVWSGALSAYADGQSALDAAVREGLGGLPLISASGLGDWAADALSDAFRVVGLQPANLDALRPATVNTVHVAQAGDGAFCARLLEVKRQAVEHPLMSNDVFSSVVGAVRRDVLQRFDAWGDSVEVATIDIGGVQVPVTVALPPAVKEYASDAIGAVADKLLSVYASVTGLRQWD